MLREIKRAPKTLCGAGATRPERQRLLPLRPWTDCLFVVKESHQDQGTGLRHPGQTDSNAARPSLDSIFYFYKSLKKTYFPSTV